MLDEAFNFNSDVLGLPDNLPFTSDTLCKVRPHLSLHKVRRRVPKKVLSPSKSKTPTKPQSSLKTVSIPLSPSPKKNKPANPKPDLKAASNIKSPGLQLIQKSPSKKPVQTSVSYPIVDLQSLVAHLNAVAKSTGCQYTTANISLPWLTALQIPKQSISPSKSSPSKSPSQILLVPSSSGPSPTRSTTPASVPSSPKVDNQSVLGEKRKTPPFTGISLIDANISKQERPSEENTLLKNDLEQLPLVFRTELKDANISEQESSSSEDTLSKNKLEQLPSESEDADQNRLNVNANMETEMSTQSDKKDSTNKLEDEQIKIKEEKVTAEERNTKVTRSEKETKQDMEVDKDDQTQEIEEVIKAGNKTKTTKLDFEDIDQKSIVAETNTMDEIAAADMIRRDKMETDKQVSKNERDKEDIANDIEEDTNMERLCHTDLEQPQPDEMSDLKEQEDIYLDQTLNSEQQETLKQIDNEKEVPDKEQQQQDETLDVTKQEVDEVTSTQDQSDNVNEYDIKSSESPSNSPSTSVDSPFDPSLFGFPNYMYREYNLRKRSHAPLSSLMYDVPSSKLPRSTKYFAHSLQAQLQSDKSDDTPEKTSEKSDILAMQEKASEKSDMLVMQEKASDTPEAQEKVTLVSEKIDTMAEDDTGMLTREKGKKPTESCVETTMEFLETMNKKITNLMQEGMKQTSFAISKEMSLKETRSRRKSCSSERVPEVAAFDPDFFSEIAALPKKEYNFRKRKSNSTGSNPTSYYPIRKRTRQSVQQELKFLEHETLTKVFTETREESPDSVFSSPQSSLKIPFVATHSSSHDNSDILSSPSVGSHNVGTSSLENKSTDNPLNKTADEVLDRPESSKVGSSSADNLTLASSQASHVPVKRIKSDEDESEVSSRARSSSCSSDWGWCHSLRNTEVRESAEDTSTEKLVVSISRKTLPLVTNYSTVTCNPIPSYSVGDIVWAKAHQLPSWPGRIISHIEWKNTKLHAPPSGQVIIYFN